MNRARSTSLPLPGRVRDAAERAVGGRATKEEFAWMSWAGTVWRLSGDTASVYVKRAASLAAERDRLLWLGGRWPVAEVVGFIHESGDDWLVTRALDGLPLSDPSIGWPAVRAAQELGAILRSLHATDAADCPFGVRRPGHVLTHGDYCLPNVLVQDGRLSGLVDVAGAGLASPEVDLAAGVWTLQYNHGRGFARAFLDAYGWPPMTDAAIEKLRRKYGR
ncbi:MAG TPA: phosphotransferase [Candidatus Dormibacteraeota bacterium]|nr:phosphotransferase [Candidatus Dormibacteraeota bacterium]